MLQLRAQIMAYRILARNQPLPPQIAMAVQVTLFFIRKKYFSANAFISLFQHTTINLY
jgi:hypothetical protein